MKKLTMLKSKDYICHKNSLQIAKSDRLFAINFLKSIISLLNKSQKSM